LWVPLGSAYFQRLLQPLRVRIQHHALLLPPGHVRLARLDIHLAALNQVRHPHPVHLAPLLVQHLLGALAVAEPDRRRQLRRQLPLLGLGHGLPVEVEGAHKGGALARVVGLEAQAEQHGLDAREAPAQVLGRRERQPQDEVAVVVLLALQVQLRVAGAAGVEGEVLVEERLHVQRRLGGRAVAERARFELGEDYIL
jgi:hypothetical protein